LRSSGANVRHGQDIDLQRAVRGFACAAARKSGCAGPSIGCLHLAAPLSTLLAKGGISVEAHA